MMHMLKSIGHRIVKPAALVLVALCAHFFVKPSQAQSRGRNAIPLAELSAQQRVITWILRGILGPTFFPESAAQALVWSSPPTGTS
jgi:hypothetical protein